MVTFSFQHRYKLTTRTSLGQASHAVSRFSPTLFLLLSPAHRRIPYPPICALIWSRFVADTGAEQLSHGIAAIHPVILAGYPRGAEAQAAKSYDGMAGESAIYWVSNGSAGNLHLVALWTWPLVKRERRDREKKTETATVRTMS